MHPSQLEPNPKRRIDDGTVLLGNREVPVVDLIAAVLGRVAAEAERTAGERPAVVTLTCPAAWGTPRQRVLLAAAAQAGLGDVRLVEEPVAAATYFAGVLGHRMPVGSAVVVYDFGAGTFDVSLVERTESGFRTRAIAGRDDIGGLDLDEVIVRRIGAVYGVLDPAGWRRLAEPTTRQDRRLRQLFRDDVRSAKERLSRYPRAEVHIAGLDRDAHVSREEFEHLARPLLDETVRITAGVAGHGGFPHDRIAGVFLVGGASRIPLVATLVHQALRIPPTVIEQPELVVAEGSIVVHSVVAGARGSAAVVGTAATPPWSGTPVPPGGSAGQPGDPTGPGERRRFRRWVAAGAALAVAVIAAVAVPLWPDRQAPATTAPAVCGIAARAEGTQPADPGSPTPEKAQPGPGWRRHVDPSGFRIHYPTGWTRFGGGACFGQEQESRYLAIDQWRQPDTDLVAYWTRKESQVAAGLKNYQKISIKNHPNYHGGAAEWEFTFDDGGQKMHVRAIAAVKGPRGYGYFWATREAIWQANLTEFSKVYGSFSPAE